MGILNNRRSIALTNLSYYRDIYISQSSGWSDACLGVVVSYTTRPTLF